jgi:hypothetical protein
MCAEASAVLRAVAADFFCNCWCLEIPSDNVDSYHDLFFLSSVTRRTDPQKLDKQWEFTVSFRVFFSRLEPSLPYWPLADSATNITPCGKPLVACECSCQLPPTGNSCCRRSVANMADSNMWQTVPWADGQAVWRCYPVLVEALCYDTQGRGFDSRRGEWIPSIFLMIPVTLGPGVVSASNRNEYSRETEAAQPQLHLWAQDHRGGLLSST